MHPNAVTPSLPPPPSLPATCSPSLPLSSQSLWQMKCCIWSSDSLLQRKALFSQVPEDRPWLPALFGARFARRQPLSPMSHFLLRGSPYPVTDACEGVIVWPSPVLPVKGHLAHPVALRFLSPPFNRCSSLYTPSSASCTLSTPSQWASQGHFLACSWALTWHQSS